MIHKKPIFAVQNTKYNKKQAKSLSDSGASTNHENESSHNEQNPDGVNLDGAPRESLHD